MRIETLSIEQAHWQLAGQRLIEMTIAEFLYEKIISLQALGEGQYQLAIDGLVYQFSAQQQLLGHWLIQPGSVRIQGQSTPAWDLNQLIVAIARSVEVKPFTLAYLVKEMNNTWLAEAHLFNPQRPSSQALIDLPAAEIEGALRGHPWLVMSKGRLGFGYQDYRDFAPEMQTPQALFWVAVHNDLAAFNGTAEWSTEQLYAHELSATQRQQFAQQISSRGFNPVHYYLLPVHPWQWHQWLVSTYAGQIASGQIIALEWSSDQYLPMQSIRTFSNTTTPWRHYVKLPLSIFNTAVYRGLPSERNKAAPALTTWLQDTLGNDAILQASGLVMLGEIATLTVAQPCFDQIDGAPYQFHELFGCLWRESVQPYLGEYDQVLSQAALVHRDLAGDSVLAALIQRSGLAPLVWLKQFVQACLPPLLYCLYRYGMVFSPHGENSLLIHQNGVPKRMVIKDFIDDMNLVDEPFTELASLPPAADLLLRHAAKDLSHFIFTGLFMVHYRYIASIFTTDFGHSEAQFWQQVADVVHEFHSNHPELNDRMQKFAILRPSFEHVCLNRVRLFTSGYADDAERPVPVILDAMDNPINPTVLQRWHACASTHFTDKE